MKKQLQTWLNCKFPRYDLLLVSYRGKNHLTLKAKKPILFPLTKQDVLWSKARPVAAASYETVFREG